MSIMFVCTREFIDSGAGEPCAGIGSSPDKFWRQTLGRWGCACHSLTKQRGTAERV